VPLGTVGLSIIWCSSFSNMHILLRFLDAQLWR